MKGHTRPCLQCGDELDKKKEAMYCSICSDGPFHEKCVYLIVDGSDDEDYQCHTCYMNDVPETEEQE